MKRLRKSRRSQLGAVATEYGLLVLGVALITIAYAGNFGLELSGRYETISWHLSGNSALGGGSEGSTELSCGSKQISCDNQKKK